MAKKTIPETLPSAHLIRAQELGLREVSFLRDSVKVDLGDGTTRNEWLPRDLIGTDGKSLIIFRSADETYSIDGYEPWHDGMWGGRKASIHSALHWVETAIGVRAGTIKDFLGA